MCDLGVQAMHLGWLFSIYEHLVVQPQACALHFTANVDVLAKLSRQLDGVVVVRLVVGDGNEPGWRLLQASFPVLVLLLSAAKVIVNRLRHAAARSILNRFDWLD